MTSKSIHFKSCLILSVMILGLGIIYPKVMHNMLLYLLGMNDEFIDKNEFIPPKIRDRNDHEDRKANSINAVNYSKVRTKSKSWSVFIPVYGIAIFLFFLYNVNKVTFFSKPKKDEMPENSWMKSDFNVGCGNYSFSKLFKEECGINENSVNDELSTDSFKRDDIMKLIEKVQEDNLEGQQMEVIYSRLQKAELKLMDMMGKVKNIHSSFADISKTINYNEKYPKSILEDDEIAWGIPNIENDDDSLYTASEGEI